MQSVIDYRKVTFNLILGSLKTFEPVIVALLNVLVELQLKVLFVTFKHETAQNILKQLYNSNSKLALATSYQDEETKSDKVKPFCENYIYVQTGCKDAIWQVKQFDYCVMTEASQFPEPLALGPILLSKRFVLIAEGPIAKNEGI